MSPEGTAEAQSRPKCVVQRKDRQVETITKPKGAASQFAEKLIRIANPAEAGAKAHRFFKHLRHD